MTYATREQVRDALKLQPDDTAMDDQIDRVLNAATTEVNNICHRRFDLAEEQSARLFAAIDPVLLLVDDFAMPEGVIVETSDGSTWTTVDEDDYQFEPLNSLRDGMPWALTRIVGLNVQWPVYRKARVRVTAQWGWLQVPDPIVEATILMCVRTLKRPDAPFGITYGELGAIQVQSSDPDIRMKLEPYEKIGGIG